MAKRKKSRRGKRKPTAFNKCVGRVLQAATYKGKKQWQGEFRKAVRKCS